MLDIEPQKTYRGTWDEILSHQSEIPPGAMVEVKVFEFIPETDEEMGDFGGLSFAEAFKDLIGAVHGGPPDMAAHPEK